MAFPLFEMSEERNTDSAMSSDFTARLDVLSKLHQHHFCQLVRTSDML